MSSTSASVEDLIDRCTALQLPGASQLKFEDFSDKEVSNLLRTFCCALGDAISSSTASAKLAAKQIHTQQASDAKAFLKSLQRLHDSVCGPSKRNLTRLQLLERLVGHLQAARILALQDTSKAEGTPAQGASGIERVSSVLRELAELMDADSAESAAAQLQAIHRQLEALVSKLPPGFFDSLIPEGSFDKSQEQQIESLFRALQQEYRVRRKMLIERVKVTLQSMLWSKEYLDSKGTTQQASAAALEAESKLHEEPSVNLADVYTASIGDVLAVTSKATSGDKAMSEATVKSILIGKVPDRGGALRKAGQPPQLPCRTGLLEPPPQLVEGVTAATTAEGKLEDKEAPAMQDAVAGVECRERGGEGAKEKDDTRMPNSYSTLRTSGFEWGS